MPRTKIVATLGPASDDEDTLRAMFQAGLNVARLNFSHGQYPDHAERVRRIRRLSGEAGRPVAILADLQGPKLRVGEIEGGAVDLVAGNSFAVVADNIVGDATRVTAPYPELPHDAQVGDRILLGDGIIELRVTGVTGHTVETVVVNGGTLRSRQGVNLPGMRVSLESLTEKDREDLVFALEQEVDYVALSFVRHPRDIQELRYAMLQHGNRLPIVAKIEKLEAVENIDAIIAAADAIMVARGDLGVELPAERVPAIQKTIIRKSRLAARPVITATQMLESMIQNPRPTRAEASDVANAILDGTDAVMLSAETAIGKHPIKAVQMMTRIAEVTEKTMVWRSYREDAPTTKSTSITDAISRVTVEIAAEVHANAILAATASGTTAMAVARWRPETRIIGVTHNEAIARRLALVWGVHPLPVGPCSLTEEMTERAITAASAVGYIKPGETVVMTAGMPMGIPGRTNSLQVQIVGEGTP